MARTKVKNGEKSQSEARMAATVCNWSGKTLSPGALLAVLYFSSCHIFFRPFRLSLVPTICPWVSEDVFIQTLYSRAVATRQDDFQKRDKVYCR